jgi:hypothetical protein
MEFFDIQCFCGRGLTVAGVRPDGLVEVAPCQLCYDQSAGLLVAMVIKRPALEALMKATQAGTAATPVSVVYV